LHGSDPKSELADELLCWIEQARRLQRELLRSHQTINRSLDVRHHRRRHIIDKPAVSTPTNGNAAAMRESAA